MEALSVIALILSSISIGINLKDLFKKEEKLQRSSLPQDDIKEEADKFNPDYADTTVSLDEFTPDFTQKIKIVKDEEDIITPLDAKDN